MFCHVAPEQVLAVHDVSSTYHVPLLLERQGMVRYFEKRLGINIREGIPEPMRLKGRELRTRWKELTIGWVLASRRIREYPCFPLLTRVHPQTRSGR